MKKISYLALGDSYTIGEGVFPFENFPFLLSQKLLDYGIEVKQRTIIAKTGWTTSDLKQGIDQSGISNKTYDLVSILIGVNNQYQGKSIEEYQSEFTELLTASIKFADGKKEKVFVLSIPDYGYTPFGKSNQVAISDGIKKFNLVNKKVSESMGVKYFDITPISKDGLNNPFLLSSDGLHPSGKMYQQWVDFMISEVAYLIDIK